ncbi:hypothetical protein SAMN05192573_104480 [Mucilaginibacter gossypii]|uniref:Uncharacterized protein n=1 Tax=Mucilaginibacter gossypii TaxID=551996 RepID=A0A1G7WMF9_9SPHI|nr:hypothetical protein SAMN05192573_104480 [Mucilaginibacter gossypii]
MDEELKRKAYLQASRLKNEGLDNEVIYAGSKNRLSLLI